MKWMFNQTLNRVLKTLYCNHVNIIKHVYIYLKKQQQQQKTMSTCTLFWKNKQPDVLFCFLFFLNGSHSRTYFWTLLCSAHRVLVAHLQLQRLHYIRHLLPVYRISVLKQRNCCICKCILISVAVQLPHVMANRRRRQPALPGLKIMSSF